MTEPVRGLDFYAIEGTGEPNTRLDVDEFSTNPIYKIQWDLFLRALAQLQTATQDDAIGYFNVAGIHGWPLLTWPQLQQTPGKQMYCSHGNPWFLTWHRAYTLLIEQRVSQIACDMAALAPESMRDQYMAEAKKIRFPIWDFAWKSAMPASIVHPDAYVIIPEIHPTEPQQIDNPLYSYQSIGQPNPPFGDETARYSDRTVQRNMERYGIRSLVYHAITGNKEQPGQTVAYKEFSNTIDGKSSIEQPHNLVHNAISIIMADPMVTAFDPIFWLTHVTIDYYFTMWQTINPDTVFSDRVDGNSIGSPLRPFYRMPLVPGTERPWTSAMVQRSAEPPFPTTYEFGYQYPETLVGMTPQQRQDAVQKALDRYKPPATDTAEYPPGETGKDHLKALPGYIHLDKAKYRREWRVVLKVKKNMVDSNFIIIFFFGNPGENPLQWGSHKNVVGAYSSLKAPLQHCQNCRDHEAHMLQGTIYLTDSLHEHMSRERREGRDGYQLHDNQGVAGWLGENLYWRIRKTDGTEHIIPEDDTTTLTVEVESFMEAYVPLDAKLDVGQVEKILGHTFDHQTHPEAITPRSSS